MAYMSQVQKKLIHTQLKKLIPPSWKWTLAVRNHSSLVLNIWSAPVDFMGALHAHAYKHWEWKDKDKGVMSASAPIPPKYCQINPYHWVEYFGADSYALKYNTDPQLAHKPENEINWGPLGEDTIRLFGCIRAALDGKDSGGKENFDKSDIQSDYFNVDWYVDIHLGTYEKPYVNTAGSCTTGVMPMPEIKIPPLKISDAVKKAMEETMAVPVIYGTLTNVEFSPKVMTYKNVVLKWSDEVQPLDLTGMSDSEILKAFS